jgi:predicted phosphodiesterase
MGSEGFEFRTTVSSKTSCPSIKVDGELQKSSPRFKGEKKFQTKVCSIKLGSAKNIEYQNHKIEIPTRLEKIAIIGDTGCRVKIKKNTLNDKNLQDCSDTNKWPAEKIAGFIKKQNPDLIIHVGDYVYREKCENPRICDKYPVKKWHLGKGYDSWKVDFLEPFSEVLKSAPWVFVRGNHENCNREWLGYKALLSPFAFSKCDEGDDGSQLSKNSTEKPYSFTIDKSSFVVFDSAGESDRKLRKLDYETYAQWFEKYKDQLKNSWLLTHKPIYNLNYNAQTSQRQALEKSKIDIPFILSGHVHLFEWVNSNPLQMIVGNSGTKLDIFRPRLEKMYPKSFQFEGFGYVIATPLGSKKHEFVLYDKKDVVVKRFKN